MARKSNAQPLGAVIKELLRVYGLDKKLREVDVRVAWEKVMGATIASKTRSIHLKDGVVQITMDSGVLKQEFSFAKTKIKDLLNEELGRNLVQEVKIY